MAKRGKRQPPQPPPPFKEKPTRRELRLEAEIERLKKQLEHTKKELAAKETKQSAALARAHIAIEKMRNANRATKKAKREADLTRDETPNQPLNRLRAGEWVVDGNAKMVFAKASDAYYAPGLRNLNLVSRVDIKGETFYPPADVIRGGFAMLVDWFAFRNITLDDLDVEAATWTVEGYSGTQSPGGNRR